MEKLKHSAKRIRFSINRKLQVLLDVLEKISCAHWALNWTSEDLEKMTFWYISLSREKLEI
ncbi:hypothetical protein FF52_22814 [Flavobacterium sp. F52]|nr:hypothetical protein FF52_22814 [Flavobacterium sp. F52]